jgi:hypothetical protein
MIDKDQLERQMLLDHINRLGGPQKWALYKAVNIDYFCRHHFYTIAASLAILAGVLLGLGITGAVPLLLLILAAGFVTFWRSAELQKLMLGIVVNYFYKRAPK